MMDKWITPLSIIFQFIVIMSGITYAPAYYTKYEGVYTFPDFAEGLGWLMVVSPLALIVGGMIVQSIRYGGVSTIIEIFPINFPLVYSRTYDLITISIRAWLLKKPEVWLFLYNLKRTLSLLRIKVRWKHSLFYRSPKLWKLNPTGAQLWMKTEPADTHPEASQILARMNQLGQLTWVTWVKKGDRMLSTIKTVMTTDYKWTDKKSMLQWIALVCIVNKFLYTHIYIYFILPFLFCMRSLRNIIMLVISCFKTEFLYIFIYNQS